VLGSVLLALLIWRAREGRERTSELDDALARVREEIDWRGPAIALAVIVALGLVAALARNPSRWPVLLLALAALAAAVAAIVLRTRRRDR
jgi:Na+/H+ antiporter NhaD/arsenite permease-like protein